MSDWVSDEPFFSKPYDDDFVFKVPSMKLEAYKDGEFEHDERLLLTALTGRYKLKADGFHRLIAKFIMHLNDFSSPFENVKVEVPPFASEFKFTGQLSNQIEFSDVFYDDLNEEQLEKLPFEDAAKNYHLKTESDFLQAKSWLFAAISSLLIRTKIRNPKNQKGKYRNLCQDKLGSISSLPLFNLDKTPLKIAINFGKLEKVMKIESDALRFAICWMVLVFENYPRSKATYLFMFCFLNSAKTHGLVLFVHWNKFGNYASSKLKWRRLNKIAENVDGVSKSIENLVRFFEELPTKADADGKQKVVSSRWSFCRLVDPNYFAYMGISANLKACLVFLFVATLFLSPDNQYPEFVKSREKRSSFQKLTEEEEDYLKKDHKYFEVKLRKENRCELCFFSSVADAEKYERKRAEWKKENPDSDSDY